MQINISIVLAPLDSHPASATVGVTMDTFSWQQIVLHKQSIRQYIHSLLDSSGSGSCKGLKKKITRTMSIYYTKKRNHPSHNALFFFIHVPKNHSIPPMLLSYG
jgi:hypothetical protein